MTCLYCGKKLGFFSRYKDTPFCSEDHLRLHQDEMEKALMERLGSKLTAQPGRNEQRQENAPEKAAVGEKKSPDSAHFDAPLEAENPRLKTSREGRGERIFQDAEVTFQSPPPPPAPARELAPIPAAERPINKNSLLGLEAPPPPPPKAIRETAKEKSREVDESPAAACEDFFEPETNPISLLDPGKPLFSPQSFAIIIQADFCAPSLPPMRLKASPRPTEDTYTLDANSLEAAKAEFAQVTPSAQLPPAMEAAEFPVENPALPRLATDFLPSISELAGEPKVDLWDTVPMEESLLSLAYEAGAATQNKDATNQPLGGRPELPLRPRQRIPLASSLFMYSWGEGLGEAESFPWTHAEEWGGIALPSEDNLLLERVAEQPASIAPHLEVSLSLHALAQKVVANPEEIAFERDPLGQTPATPTVSAIWTPETELTEWPPYFAKPLGSRDWQPRFRFPRSAAARSMAGVNFPSLFHLKPALPPKPEGGAYHA
ncbi:MAG: hypothetical protein OHK0021_06370 [Bryobacter sp.]